MLTLIASMAKYDFHKLIYIEQLIKRKATGCPKELAKKVGLSERTLFEYLSFLKRELKAPIKFCKQRKSYYYQIDGGINFFFAE